MEDKSGREDGENKRSNIANEPGFSLFKKYLTLLHSRYRLPIAAHWLVKEGNSKSNADF